jgi:hypothetical protein
MYPFELKRYVKKVEEYVAIWRGIKRRTLIFVLGLRRISTRVAKRESNVPVPRGVLRRFSRNILDLDSLIFRSTEVDRTQNREIDTLLGGLKRGKRASHHSLIEATGRNCFARDTLPLT